MTMIATAEPVVLTGASAEAKLADVRFGLETDRLIPYLGPKLAALAGEPPVPILPEDVAARLHARAPAPSKIRTNMWSVAQFIEQRRHRKTLIALMAEIFAPPVAPSKLQTKLAALPLSLIVHTWYDASTRAALVASGRTDWVEIQGVTRSGENRDIWTRTYGVGGTEIAAEAADRARTVLYAPHGSVAPAKNFLVADSDYVEVLTEIDIQSPIPEIVKGLRATRGFVFVGCRFHDQMLRTYARQIAKRSAGPLIVVTETAGLTKNELKFFAEIGAEVIDLPLVRAVDLLVD